MLPFPRKLVVILNNICDLTAQNIAKPGKNIRIDPLHSTGTPFFYHLETGVCQFGKPVAGDPPLFDQFF